MNNVVRGFFDKKEKPPIDFDAMGIEKVNCPLQVKEIGGTGKGLLLSVSRIDGQLFSEADLTKIEEFKRFIEGGG